MRFLFYLLFPVLIPFAVIFYSCGTSTGSRYQQKNQQTSKNEKEENRIDRYPEDFNLSSYHAKIDLPDSSKKSTRDSVELWYGYDNTPSNFDTTQIPLKTMEGYRVQVLITDDLDEANNMRSEIYSKTNQKAIYIVFDPPFYKVEVGDFQNIADANSFSFQLKQLGYSDARVINETINIF